MPWKASSAKRHTKKANTPTKQRQWAHVANAVLKKTGNEARAIRAADSVVKRKKTRKSSTKRKSR